MELIEKKLVLIEGYINGQLSKFFTQNSYCMLLKNPHV